MGPDMSVMSYLLLASLLRSTTYGYNELKCGDVGKAVPCSKGAVTASGVEFNPDVASVAVSAPFKLRLKSQWIRLKVAGGKCHKLKLLDKMHPRYIGKRGFDLTPAAVKLLTGKAGTKVWSGRVELCR